MVNYLNKLTLGLNVYWQARQTVRRQYYPNKIRRIQNQRLKKLIQFSSQIKYYNELFCSLNYFTTGFNFLWYICDFYFDF